MSEQIITWQPVLTDHQAVTFSHVEKQTGWSSNNFVRFLEDDQRKLQGWSKANLTNQQVVVIPEKGKLYFCFKNLMRYRSSTHIFCSSFGDWAIFACLFMASILDVKFFLISEPYSPESYPYHGSVVTLRDRVKKRLRPLFYHLYFVPIKRKCSGVFAISTLAVRQFIKAGMPASKIFPFGYFVKENPEELALVPREVNETEPLKLIYIGNLVPRKGFDIAAESADICSTNGRNVSLDIFGPSENDAVHFSNPKVKYKGKIPFGEAQRYLKGYDLALVPSRHDGWGVLVNEAIDAGVPVICSDRVGASVIVKKFGCGAVYEGDDSQRLAQTVMEIDLDRDLLRSMRLACIPAGRAISPAIAAAYMVSVITDSDPISGDIDSPWY